MNSDRLPRIAHAIICLFIPRRDRDYFMESMIHAFEQILEERDRFAAHIWLLGQILRSLPAFILGFIEGGFAMLKNYLSVALRTMKRQKMFTTINILGLAIGLACCLLIFQYVRHERSYDTLHEDLDRLYRLSVTITSSAGEESYAVTAPAATTALVEHYPQVEAAARVMLFETNRLVRRGDLMFYEEGFIYADADIFKVLTIPFIQGNPEDALVGPDKVVIPQRLADKYFGNQDALGEILNINGRDFSVTGVVENAPLNTHLRADLLVSMDDLRDPPWMTDWSWQGMWGYIKLRPGVDAEAFGKQIEHLADPFIEGDVRVQDQSFLFSLTPIRDIYLHSDLQYELASGNPILLTVFSLVGFFVLLIACVNFMNLSTARSMNRSLEVGIRKVIGAERGSLMRQFLGESLLLSGLAAVLALIFTEAVRSFFNGLTGMELSQGVSFSPENTLMIVMLTLITGILGGLYPAFMLSSFRPVHVLKRIGEQGVSGARFRKILVITQFSISILLILCTLTVFRQLHFMRQYDLGFDKIDKLVIPVRGRMPLANNYQTLKDAFLQDPLFLGGSVSSGIPGRYSGKLRMKKLDEGETRNQLMYYEAVDEDYLTIYGMKIAAGRSFSRSHSTDREGACVINAAAVRAFGWATPEEAIGKFIEIGMFSTRKEVIGVLEDYYFRGPQFAIEPQVLELEPRQFQYLSFSFRSGQHRKALETAERIWSQFYAERPLEHFYLDSYFNDLYENEEHTYRLFSYFSFLGIFIASLGLLGLASFMAERKRKEIGIRKVVGASSPRILIMLSRTFTKSVLIANIIAWPLAYVAMNRWLNQFANRTPLSIDLFILSGLLAFIVALITVSWQSMRAARANPVDSLIYE